MKVIKRMGLGTAIVALALLAFATIGGTKAAQASGPYNGPYQPTCVQWQTAYSGQWQWNGWTWQWVSVPQTVCVRWATFYFRQQYVPQYLPQYPIFYTPVNNCLQPLPGGGFYNACLGPQQPIGPVPYGGIFPLNPVYWHP